MEGKIPRTSIIMPAYNEEKRIARALEEYGKFFEKIGNTEILIVVNNTTDHTPEIVREYQKRFDFIRMIEFKQGGKGFAIRKGFEDALKRNIQLIGFVDADMATPPKAFNDLILKIDNFGGVLASRYHKNSVLNPPPTFIRWFTSRGFNFLVRVLFLFNFRDTQCGAKLFRKEVLEKIVPELSISQWACDIDILYNAHKKGFKIREIPTYWEDVGYSKIDLKKSTPQMFFAVAQLRILNSSFKRHLKIIKPIVKLLYKLVK